jgi:phenylacetate-CoA ligase
VSERGTLRWAVRHAYEGSDFYRAKLDAAGVDPAAVEGPEDLPRLPFTTKEELRQAQPFGWTCVPLEDVVRVHASTGTTGRRTISTYTAQDLDDWAELFRRALEVAGVTRSDRFLITPGFGLWSAGAGFQAGVERLGALAIPTGPGNVELQFEMLLELGATAIAATSSFSLLLAEEAARRGLAGRLSLRLGILGSERWGDAMRRQIEAGLGIESFDLAGFTELYGPGMAIDCHLHDGLHYWDDHYVVEIVDPSTGDVLPAGEEGEMVVTTLRKEAQPLLRYRTRDLTSLLPGACACGSRFPRHGRIRGRTDDMFKVRGVQIFPAQIDSVLAAVGGGAGEYQVRLTREGGRDRFVVRVEGEPELAGALSDRLQKGLGVRPDVDIVPPGTLPRTERKTRRVFDERE